MRRALFAALAPLFAAAILPASAAPLTRAEIIDRLKAPVYTKVDGLVKVYADCPPDMRREYQMPAASFAASVCRSLYSGLHERPRRFAQPGIVVHIGSSRTNDATVAAAPHTRADGSRFMRIDLPAPAYSDLDAFRLAVVRGFVLAVRDREIDESEALETLLGADPRARMEINYAEIRRWLRGEKIRGDDEDMLKLCRSVLDPGDAHPSDVLRFASRLYLYPATYDKPFAGRYHCCTFAQAVELSDDDPRVRFAALFKASQIMIFGGGRGEELAAAAEAYSRFLFALAAAKDSAADLLGMLEDADMKLNIAFEKARERHPQEK